MQYLPALSSTLRNFMVPLHFVAIGLISFWPFNHTDSIGEQPKKFQKENVVQYSQSIYAIDAEEKAWKGSVKNKKELAGDVIDAQVHPILFEKKLVALFADAEGKPIFEDESGSCYDEDGNVSIDPVIKSAKARAVLQHTSGIDFSRKSPLAMLDESHQLLLSETDASSIPVEWQLKYFGYVGVDPDAPAPNGSGQTIFQCYLQGIEPVALEPITMSISATGPFRDPANVTLVASITHPANVEISHIDFFYRGTNAANCLGHATTEPYEITTNLFGAGCFVIQAKAYDSNACEVATATMSIDVLPSNRYFRGLLPGVYGMHEMNYVSSIVALDFQHGVSLDGTNNTSLTDFDHLYSSGYPWFLRTASDLKGPCYHLINANGALDYVPVNMIPTVGGVAVGDQPPMVAFGSQAGLGATPLFVDQAYHFGIAGGGEKPEAIKDLKIEVYERSAFDAGNANVPPVFVADYKLPSLLNKSDSDDFSVSNLTQDYHLLTNWNGKIIDFDTQVTYQINDPESTWGQSGKYNFILTHKAANDLFYYKVSFMGAGCTEKDAALFDMAKNSSKTTSAYNISYSLDFEKPLPWRSVFINQPHFQTIPLPSEYQGKSIDELLHQTPAISDAFTAKTPEQIEKETGYDLRLLNHSTELKDHSLLDKLVSDLEGDPIKIANYVLNEIELTDAIGLGVENGEASDLDKTAINPQGVNRDALATYLEGQGSPIEQCALLIYLLRKAGYSAAYVFPDHNKTLMFDQELSKILKMQFRGTMSCVGNMREPELIPVNYPWVVFFDKDQKKWIHLFPWIKNIKVKEGKDLWNYFPSGYNTPRQWLLKYLLNDGSVRNPLETKDPAILREDNVGTLFPLYAAKQLALHNLTIDDVGIQFTHQPCYYESWDEFPRPWATSPISNGNLAQNLEADQNTKLKPEIKNQLADIFDTIEITVISDRKNNGSVNLKDHPGDPVIQTGVLRMANLHDRALLLHHEVETNHHYKMILSLDPYDATQADSEHQTNSFYSGNNPTPSSDQLLRGKQAMSVDLDDRDNSILYHILYRHHQQVLKGVDYSKQFFGIDEMTTIDDTRPLFKGDMACLSLFYGRVSPEMMNFQNQKFIQLRDALNNGPAFLENQNAMKGQYLAIVGQSYYQMVGETQQMLERMNKLHAVSYAAHGLTKLSPLRDDHNQIVLTTDFLTEKEDLNLVYPNVDMSFQTLVHVNNSSTHLEASNASGSYIDVLGNLLIGEISADEHRVIDKLYGQKNAISTVKLLDIAQGWTSEVGLATHPGEGAIVLTANNYQDEGKKSYIAKRTSDHVPLKKTLSEWGDLIGGYWSNQVKSTLQVSSSAEKNFIIMTPGPVTASGQEGGVPYTGMGAMVFTPLSAGALITGRTTINGGYGEPTYQFENNGDSIFLPPTTIETRVKIPDYYKLETNPPSNSNISISNPLNPQNSPFGYGGQYYHDPRFLNPSTPSWQTPSQPSWQPPSQPSPPPSSPANPTITAPPAPSPAPPTPSPTPPVSQEKFKEIVKKTISEKGNTGSPVFYGKLKNFVMDPVSVVTGEFYVNAVDLKLAGPMPLEVRRIYSSQSSVNENLGHGWRLSYFSYLALSSDSETTPTIINAAEMDGSVISYRYNKDQQIWMPLPSDNPTLINENDGANLISKNLFNNRITQTTSDGAIAYTLSSADGSKRVFKVHPEFTHQRPYLDSWSDHQGNSYQFFFGQNKQSSDYEQLIRIASSNGNTIRFNYDNNGHIVKAFSSDGRLLKYTYDSNGDLVQVTLSDGTKINYSYKILDQDSPHLLVQEIKPEGRSLQNNYDALGRVITQYATTGVSPTATLSGTFNYSLTATNADNTFDGTTLLVDGAGNKTTYTISHNQMTSIACPENRTITQTWNVNESSRSLASAVDVRGLITSYDYDGSGNVISRSLKGDITGSGASETAKTTSTYNSLNVLSSTIDAVGNITKYTYNNASFPYNPTTVMTTAPSGQTVNALQIEYTKSGGASGLVSSLNNNGAITTYTYDQHGFPNSITQKTGTKDPDLTTTLTCNARGEIIAATDALGQKKKYFYDGLGRPTGVEVYDKTGALIDWHFKYYNYNGEIEWEQGARLNPVDYTYYDYDRAGHLLHKATYLIAGASAWAGELVMNNNVALTSYNYDAQGNCISMTDPNGNITTMGNYDALGNMGSRTLADGTKESFSYEAGGNVASHTTVLGAAETFTYTSTGLIKSACRADGSVTQYQYDLMGHLVKEQSSQGPTCNITYNGNVTTKTFNASGKSLGSTSESYDGRGNLLQKTDLAGNQWNYSYDNLNRLKTEQGPPTSGTSAQQSVTHYYALNFETLLNGAGEWTNRSLGAMGRSLIMTSYNKDGSIAQTISNHYSGDHQSIETTVGTGTNAITTTTYTDTRERPLTIQNSDGKCKIFTYDPNGNLTFVSDEDGLITCYSYDSLNHLASETILPDGTFIAYKYDAAGNLLTRSMPHGLKEQNSYNAAGQKTSSALFGGDEAVTRNFAYQYQNGLLSSIQDPRGFTTSIAYDDWKRPVSLVSSGASLPEQNQTTGYKYDPRGFLVAIAQHYNDAAAGPSTLVSRSYDAYGQLTSETTSLNNSNISSWSQRWDAAGRRTALNWNLNPQSKGPQYTFSYNALGEMTSSQNGSGTYSYDYNNNGLLFQRTTPHGTISLTRDERGRITDIGNSISNLTILAEHIDWKLDNRIQSYNVLENRIGVPQESRNYGYAGRKVTQEPFMLTSSSDPTMLPNGTQTVQYLFDETNLLQLNSGNINGLGVRTTQIIDSNAANCVAAQNSLGQVTQANTYSFRAIYDWMLAYDAAGNMNKATLETCVDQTLTWDSFNRLVDFNQRSVLGHNFNPQWTSSYDWKTAYDGLGRRIQTTCGSDMINYYYDPEVAFLELGRTINGSETWNLYGPDRSGIYGGAQGIGGLETSYDQNTGTVKNWVNNYFGDALVWYDAASQYFLNHGSISFGGYGPMLGSSTPENSDPQWRGHYVDETGLYYMGARYYDPINGTFISPDPLGHSSSLSLYDYCNGDPVNGLDPDGRCVEKINNAEINVGYSWNQACNQYDSDIGARILAGIPVSILSGDAFTHYTTPQEQMNQYGFMPAAFSANGIFADRSDIIYMRSKVAEGLNFNEENIFQIQNPSYGPLDLIRAGGQEAGAIDITALRAADMINTSGGGSFVAHSNGSALFYAASALLRPEVKAHIDYRGYGPQININSGNVPRLHSYHNITGAHDLVGTVLNPNAHWDQIIPQSPLHPLDNHSFKKTYASDVSNMMTL